MQTSDMEADGQIAALYKLVPELGRLEGLLASASASNIVALQNFATNNPDLARLEKLLTAAKTQPPKFDLLQIIRPGLWKSEDVHSNIIAWLLDPQQSHGIGHYFLKNFLLRTCRTAGTLGSSAITPAIIHGIDWSKTEVRREWRYIDILILNREARFVCAIENKIFAGEGIGNGGISQLTWYRQTLAEDFPDFTNHLVFLDFKSGSPSENERPYWTPENYTTILELVEQEMVDETTALGEDVRVFLRQYAATLRREIMPELNEIDKLARQIYLEHREVIEIIYEKGKPDYREETKQIFREIISQQEGWEPAHESPALIRFRPSCWNDFAAMNTGTGWSQSHSLMLFEFGFSGDLAILQLALSPGSDTIVRENLLKSINRNPKLFNRTGRELSQWMLFYVSENILKEADLSNWDDPCVRAKIEAWVKDFAENRFPAMNEVIVNCLREYEAEQQPAQ